MWAKARTAERFEKLADLSHSLGNKCRNVASGTCKVSATTGYTAGFLKRFRGAYRTRIAREWARWVKNVGDV